MGAGLARRRRWGRRASCGKCRAGEPQGHPQVDDRIAAS
jgi:hypothetical protein